MVSTIVKITIPTEYNRDNYSLSLSSNMDHKLSQQRILKNKTAICVIRGIYFYQKCVTSVNYDTYSQHND